MHRFTRHRPPSNPREHTQRNLYARSAIQRKRLFHNTTPNYKKKLRYLIAGTFIIGVLLHWGSILAKLVNFGANNNNGNIGSKNSSNVFHQDLHHERSSVPMTFTNVDKNNETPWIEAPSHRDVIPRDGIQENEEEKDEMNPIDPDEDEEKGSVTVSSDNSSPHVEDFKCSFRKYKPHRYYDVQDLSIDFLSNAEYIRGKLPFMINPSSHDSSIPKKLCTDTSQWEQVLPNHRPFSDGQNPSFVSLKRYPYGTQNDQPRINKTTIEPLTQIYGETSMENFFLGLLLFGDSQCRWNMTAEELESNKFSPLQKAPSKRSLVMVLNDKLDPIGTAVLELEHDAPWGEKKKHGVMKKKDGSGYETSIVELDDARLFFHDGRLNVLYRNGPAFGYEKQVQNPIHFEKLSDTEFKATIKASETFTLCCGRNIAFISEIPNRNSADGLAIDRKLHALTWVDPVTTEEVSYPKITEIKGGVDTDTERRRLESKKRSSIHGTNGYLVPLHSTNELLGIAHFHRPEHRQQSDYARHGHHYTHALFTLEPTGSSTEEDQQIVSFKLKRLSNEFVFSSPSSENQNAAEVIQFASGLDLVGSDLTGKLMVSYGINDCEAAVVFLDMEKIHEILLPVQDGQEVQNLMQKLN